MRLLRRTWVYQFAGALLVSCTFAASLAAIDSRQKRLRSADTAFHAGYAAEKSGDLSSARQQFEKVVQLAPDIAEGHSALGSVLVQLGQYTQAIRELTRALALKADDRSAQINLAVAYEQSGDHEKSLALFRSLDRNAASPLSPSVVIFYIRALAGTQQTELAIEKTQGAIAAAPENPILHDTLGSLEAQRQDWNGAVSEFKEVIRLDPNFVEAHLHLGLTFMMQQRTSEAVLPRSQVSTGPRPPGQRKGAEGNTIVSGRRRRGSAECASTDQSWPRACPDREIQGSDPALPARHQGDSRRSFGASGSGRCLSSSERPR